MTLFSGVHEVRLFRPTGIAVGYFNDYDAALRAVNAEPTQYRAAYFTLNLVELPATIPLNPHSLTPSRKAVGTSDIARRVWLLVDLDPPRPAGVNSTEAEKEEAHKQAQGVREYLRSRNWPEPFVCDSGNGWHLLYRIDLPNSREATETIQAALSRLHQLFPMVDAGNFDPPRLCKLYGSWARKGQHTEERPWRLSRIVEEGSDTVVTEAQLQDFRPVPRVVRTCDDVAVLLGSGGVLFNHGAATRRGMKGEQNGPLPLGRIRRRHVKRVALSRIAGARHAVHDRAGAHVLSEERQ